MVAVRFVYTRCPFPWIGLIGPVNTLRLVLLLADTFRFGTRIQTEHQYFSTRPHDAGSQQWSLLNPICQLTMPLRMAPYELRLSTTSARAAAVSALVAAPISRHNGPALDTHRRIRDGRVKQQILFRVTPGSTHA